jgi:prepilin-type N-terminal cleavage/methylation domain-containing protein
MWAKNKQGFTIVELLVVIVVIGVLASLVVVAYNRISQRAENNKTISAVNQVIKLLGSYKELNNGNYPNGASGLYSCIGSDYTDGVCYDATSGGFGVTARVSSAFNTALQTVGNLPQASTKKLTMGSNGFVVAGASFDTGFKLIRYHLEGDNQPCVISGATGPFNYGGVTQCRIVLP